MKFQPSAVLLVAPLAVVLSACTLKVAAPEKPITINLNVKIEHEVRIKVEKDLENLFESEDGYSEFGECDESDTI